MKRLTVAQLEKERETRHAFQEQCAFLGQELFKLETELKQHKILIEEQKNKILERERITSNMAHSPKSRLSSFSDFASLSRASSSSSVASSSGVPPADLDNSQVFFFIKLFINFYTSSYLLNNLIQFYK